MKKLALLGFALAATLPLMPMSSSCVSAGGVVYVPVPPPAAEVEVIGVAPGPDHVWIHGYHRWNGSAYVWTAGHWEVRHSPKAVWVDGRWEHHQNGWYRIEGHWE